MPVTGASVTYRASKGYRIFGFTSAVALGAFAVAVALGTLREGGPIIAALSFLFFGGLSVLLWLETSARLEIGPDVVRIRTFRHHTLPTRDIHYITEAEGRSITWRFYPANPRAPVARIGTMKVFRERDRKRILEHLKGLRPDLFVQAPGPGNTIPPIGLPRDGRFRTVTSTFVLGGGVILAFGSLATWLLANWNAVPVWVGVVGLALSALLVAVFSRSMIRHAGWGVTIRGGRMEVRSAEFSGSVLLSDLTLHALVNPSALAGASNQQSWWTLSTKDKPPKMVLDDPIFLLDERRARELFILLRAHCPLRFVHDDK